MTRRIFLISALAGVSAFRTTRLSAQQMRSASGACVSASFESSSA